VAFRLKSSIIEKAPRSLWGSLKQITPINFSIPIKSSIIKEALSSDGGLAGVQINQMMYYLFVSLNSDLASSLTYAMLQ
jgi:hypothetical protein